MTDSKCPSTDTDTDWHVPECTLAALPTAPAQDAAVGAGTVAITADVGRASNRRSGLLLSVGFSAVVAEHSGLICGGHADAVEGSGQAAHGLGADLRPARGGYCP